MFQFKSRIKVYLFITVILTVVLGIILFAVYANTDSIISELTLHRVRSANRELVQHIQNLQENILRRTESIARDKILIKAIKNNDFETLKTYLIARKSNIDFASVCDANGIVCVRTHSDVTGDDLWGYQAVSQVLRTGVSAISIENIISRDNHLSIFASSPVYDNDTLIGIVNCNYDLEENKLLESIMNDTGCSSSIFQGNVRINTTLLNYDGTRAIGQSADERVIETVIGQGNEYIGRLPLFGKIHEVCYAPLISNGQIIGMLGAGFNIDSKISKQRNMRFLLFLAFLLSIAAVIFFMVLSNRTSRKINHILAEHLNEKTASLTMMESILHTMDSLIYVTELKTDKILFVNDNMIKNFGLAGNLRGEQCWKHFQTGFDKRCDFCPKYKLEINPDEAVFWEEINTVTGRRYRNVDRIIDWPDGTKVHLQTSNDITELQDAIALEKQLELQSLMSSITRSFLSDIDVEILINENLRKVGEFMDLSQVFFFNYDNTNCTLSCSNEWINPKLASESFINTKMLLKDPLLSIINSLQPGIGKDSCIHSNDQNLSDAVSLYRSNCKHYIITPVFVKGKIVAILNFTRDDNGGQWSESEINLAILFASTLSGVFDRDAMERQYSIVENSPNIILYAEANGDLSFFNPSLVNITGYTAEELKTGGFGLIFTEKAHQDIMEIVIPQTLLKGSFHGELVLKCKDGRNRVMSTSSFKVRNDTVAAIATDVTAERALRTELIAAKEQAENASRAKSDFISRMSHEMRTPMNAIIGMTTLSRSTDESEKKDMYLDKSANAANHLLRLINDLLDINEIEDGNFKLVHTNFSFAKMLRNVLNIIGLYADEKHQTLTVEIDPSIPDALTGDEHRLSQAMYNLLMNAVKFTPEEGTILFDVCMSGEEDGIVTLRIEVTDSGIGIAADRQTVIFDLFEQADGGIDRKYGGAGIGLFLAKRIVELMCGNIWVESESGKGARFICTVKLRKDSGAELQMHDADISSFFEMPSGTLEGKTVLLVEDLDINREIVIALLENTRLNFDCAENGLRALELFSANPGRYDIIFMDINMPEMDGIEAARRIRALDGPEGARVPILAMTANVAPRDLETYMAVGINDHIGKPIDSEKLLNLLHKYLNIS